MSVMEKMIVVTRNCVNLGAFGVMLALVSGQDPFHLDNTTFVSHVEIGLALSLPLLLISALLRHPLIKSEAPIVTALHEHQQRIIQPITKDLNASQHLIVASSLCLSLLLILLPAAAGLFDLIGAIGDEFILEPAGIHMPLVWRHSLSFLVPTLLSSYIAAVVVRNSLLVNHDQLEKISDAYKRSEAFFKLSVSQERLMDGHTEAEAREAAEAFKDLVSVWFIERIQVAQLSFYLTFVNVSWISLSWHLTNDISTPLAAALVWTLVEMLLSREEEGSQSRA